jgi:hypothetical protein
MSIVQEVEDVIQIPITDVYSDVPLDVVIRTHLQKTMEGSCSHYGYVYPGSVELLEGGWTLGKIISVDSQSKVEFTVRYRLGALNPSKDDEFTCILSSKTKMGLLGFMKYKPPNRPEATEPHQSPLLVIIPETFMDSPIESYQVGQTCKVVIVEARIKYKSEQIQAVAKIV